MSNSLTSVLLILRINNQNKKKLEHPYMYHPFMLCKTTECTKRCINRRDGSVQRAQWLLRVVNKPDALNMY